MFLDSHCHLTFPALTEQFADVLARAVAADVTRVVNIGTTIEDSRGCIKQIPLAAEHGVEMRATVGIHPQNALDYDFEKTANQLRELTKEPGVVAIGEIGLDYMYDDTHEKYPGASRPLQDKVFRAQLDLARELALPIVIHNREADEDLLRVMREYTDIPAVFHCFGSPVSVAQEVLDLGFYLGFTGIVTFKNGEELREVAKICPLDKMLIETDAPYLAPVPYRGKTNEPSYVPKVAGMLASLHGVTPEEMGVITTENARRLFGF